MGTSIERVFYGDMSMSYCAIYRRGYKGGLVFCAVRSENPELPPRFNSLKDFNKLSNRGIWFLDFAVIFFGLPIQALLSPFFLTVHPDYAKQVKQLALLALQEGTAAWENFEVKVADK